MPNTRSAKKALRGSLRKEQFNNYWKLRIRSSLKNLKRNLETGNVDTDILNKELAILQKMLDKASKNKVIHRNKANRLKARYANKISVRTNKKTSKSPKGSKKGSAKIGGRKKS